MNAVVRGYTNKAECVRIRILLTVTSRGRRELFSKLSNSTEPRITHSNTSYSIVLSRSVERIKGPEISRIRNIDPGPRHVERSDD